MRRYLSAALVGATMLSASPAFAYVVSDVERMTRRSTAEAARRDNQIPEVIPAAARMRRMPGNDGTGHSALARALRQRANERAADRLDLRPNNRSIRMHLEEAESMLPPAIVETGAKRWTPRSRPSRRTVWSTAAAQYQR